MLQLVYTSRAIEGKEGASLAILCNEAARNNARDEITGVLMLQNGYFLQALEGPKVAVEDAFLRIIADDRHAELQLLVRRLVSYRHFGQFAMTSAGSEREMHECVDEVRNLMSDAPEQWRTLFEQRFAV